MSEVAPSEREPKDTVGFGDVVDTYAIVTGGDGKVKTSRLKCQGVVVGYFEHDGAAYVNVSGIADRDGEPVLSTAGTIDNYVGIVPATDQAPWTVDQVTDATAGFFGVSDQPEAVQQFRVLFQAEAAKSRLPYDFYEPPA